MVQVFNTYLKEGKPVLEEERKLPADIHFITGEKELYAFCKGTLKLHLYAEEYLYAISVNAKGKVQGVFEISHGTVDTTSAGPREIMQKLLLLGSVDFYLVHNHPSQDPSPSDVDISVTERVCRAGELLGIRLLDHMIITEKDYYSLRNKLSKRK